jgi:hypothetical protein
MQYFRTIKIGLVFIIGFFIQGPVLAESDYPAAYFKPYIVYQAPEIAGKTSAESASEEAAAEPASEAPEAEEEPYPAAYYEPVIVFQDKDAIAGQAAQAAAAPAKKAGNGPGEAKSAPAKPAAPPITDDGGFPVVVLVLIAAIFGGLYWVIRKSQGAADPTAASVEPAAPAADEATTGGESGEDGAPAEAS